MNRKFNFVLSTCMAISLSLSALLTFNKPMVCAASEALEPNTDIAKMYRVEHELKFDLKGTSAKLDGKKIRVTKAIVKNGRVFIPLRLLREIGSAKLVTWNPKKQEARVIMKDQIVPNWKDLTFRMGSDQLYTSNDQVLSDVKILKPFLSNGIVYIPVNEISKLGLSATIAEGVMTWNWSEKVIDVTSKMWEVDKDTTSFSILYQQDMYQPQVLLPYGSGGWVGGNGKVTEKNISMDGRLYDRMEYTENLRPGLNPMQIFGISSGTADIVVRRLVANPMTVPIKITENGEKEVKFNAPAHGYINAKVGQEIEIAGTIQRPNKLFNKITVVVQKYVSEGEYLGHPVFKSVESKEIPIKEDAFSGLISIREPGSYLIGVNSPNYLLYAGGNGYSSTQWAEFVVEIP